MIGDRLLRGSPCRRQPLAEVDDVLFPYVDAEVSLDTDSLK
jgi:hypothetical protein